MSAPYVLPEGSLVDVRMTVRLPHAATTDQVDEWLSFSFGQNGTMSEDNSLQNDEPEPFSHHDFEWNDTGETGRVVDTDRQELGDGRATWKRRYVREIRR